MRKDDIKNYAMEIIDAYTNRRGLKLFYKIKGVKIERFNNHAPNYFKWLLAAVPEGYRYEVERKIQALRPNLKEIVRENLPSGVIPHQKPATALELFGGAEEHEQSLLKDIPEEDR